MKDLFLDCNFPQEGCFFIRHSVEFFTNVQTTKNGYETRVILSEFGRSKFKLEESILQPEKINEIYKFFKIVKGRGFSFRFFDELDNKLEDGILLQDDSEKLFLLSTFEYKNYSLAKKITKPKKGTVVIKNGDITLCESKDYIVHYQTGEVTLMNDGLNLRDIKCSCNFDIEVRFESDELLIQKDSFGNFYIQNLSLIEVI